jgi:mono/diheme cytochrome c family protein
VEIGPMTTRAAFFLLALFPSAQAAAAEELTPQQIRGHQIVTQNCLLCHAPNTGAEYTPLNKDAANGDDKLMHEVIGNGLVAMPGWKYTLTESDIDDVIAFVRTVPVSAAPPQSPRKSGANGETAK